MSHCAAYAHTYLPFPNQMSNVRYRSFHLPRLQDLKTQRERERDKQRDVVTTSLKAEAWQAGRQTPQWTLAEYNLPGHPPHSVCPRMKSMRRHQNPVPNRATTPVINTAAPASGQTLCLGLTLSMHKIYSDSHDVELFGQRCFYIQTHTHTHPPPSHPRNYKRN